MSSFTLKNILVYRIPDDIDLSLDMLEQKLATQVFTSCGSYDMARIGWVSPLGSHSDRLFHVANNSILLTANREEKILPADVISEAVGNKVEKMEHEQHRKLKKTEKIEIRRYIIEKLLPDAFSRHTKTSLWIDLNLNLIFIDAKSVKKAEDVLRLLRKSIGSLPVVPATMIVDKPIDEILTQWVVSKMAPGEFLLNGNVRLYGDGIIDCKGVAVTSDEIISHVFSGRFVTNLSLAWRDRVYFDINSDMQIRKIKFSDCVIEKNIDISEEDFAQRFYADFILFTSEVSAMFKELLNAFAGNEEVG